MTRLPLLLLLGAACTPGTITGDGDLTNAEPLLETIPGKYNDMAADGDRVLIVAYDRRYGDLVAADWGPTAPLVFAPIAGVPAGPRDHASEGYRGGVAAPGADVGHWCSVALSRGRGLVAYHHATDGTLQFAAEAGSRWRTHEIDHDGERVGLYASLSVGPDGRPGVAYMVAGESRAELRWADATNDEPESTAQWRVQTIASAELADDPRPGDDMPRGLGLFASAAHLPDGSPAVAYYDRSNDALMLATRTAGGWNTQQIDEGAGQFASMVSGDDGTLHIAYRETRAGKLRYVAVRDGVASAIEIVDDGHREPNRHRVGAGAALALDTHGAPAIAYQDEFDVVPLLARRDATGWRRALLPGADTGFGFATSIAGFRGDLRVLTYGYDRSVYPPGALLLAEVTQ